MLASGPFPGHDAQQEKAGVRNGGQLEAPELLEGWYESESGFKEWRISVTVKDGPGGAPFTFHLQVSCLLWPLLRPHAL